MKIPSAIRWATHPFVLWLIIAASLFLWMPFGIGYHGWPWERVSYRILIQVAAFTFVLLSITGFFLALRAERSVFRLITSVVALLVAVYGVLALYGWKDDYLAFVRERDRQNSVEPSSPAIGAAPRR